MAAIFFRDNCVCETAMESPSSAPQFYSMILSVSWTSKKLWKVITDVGFEVKMNIPSLSVLFREKIVWSGLDRQMLFCLLLLFSFVMTQFKTLDCLQELLIAHEPQAMYLGNRYWHSDCIFMIYIILNVV